MKMTKTDALCALVYDAMKERTNLVSYARCCRALRILELSEDDVQRVLKLMDYHDNDGRPYRWIELAKEKAAGKKAIKSPADILRTSP